MSSDTKILIADEKENVWRDDSGDIWEPIRAKTEQPNESPLRGDDWGGGAYRKPKPEQPDELPEGFLWVKQPISEMIGEDAEYWKLHQPDNLSHYTGMVIQEIINNPDRYPTFFDELNKKSSLLKRESSEVLKDVRKVLYEGVNLVHGYSCLHPLMIEAINKINAHLNEIKDGEANG